MSYLAPAGTPIGAGALWRWISALPGKQASVERFRAALTERFGLQGCEFVASGRAGMTLLLETLYALRNDPLRNEVIVPGYTCYSVPASIERAGLRVRVCDIHSETLNYDLARLADFDFSRVLAIVSTNLYGIPNDLRAIGDLARERGVFLVDDAAQAMGATCAGQPVGTRGDVGLFSLDKGKNITSMQGGILITRDATIAAALKRRVDVLPPPALGDTVLQVIKMLVYAALLPPARYGITQRLPFLGLGRTPFVTRTPVTRYSPALGAMAEVLFSRIDSLGAIRRNNAQRILDSVAGLPEISAITPPADSEAVYVRLPLLARDRQMRDTLIRSLNAAGIGATISYPSAVVDVPELRARLDARDIDCPQARAVSERIFTLPTHPFVTPVHISQMAAILRGTGIVRG